MSNLLELKNNRCSEEEFKAMSILDKRTYIIQTEQEETMRYQKIVAQIQLYSFVFGVFIGVITLLALMVSK